MKVRWLGHSAVMLEGSKKILIDPFLTGNPAAAIAAKDVTECDFVVVTHGHGDHIGDAFDIAEATGATVVSIFEVTSEAEGKGLPVEPMNIGGSIETGGVRFSMVAATHSSPGSAPTGMIVEMDGKTVYHMGDTGLMADMALLPEFFDIDLVLVPCGDRFTMGAPSAAKAVEMVKAKRAVPIHYGTFPVIDASPDRFARLARKHTDVLVMKPGDQFDM
ncbi:MAG: metal-dependent hydrolase [Candidatus Eisenbacteria bacterium]